MVVTLIGYRGSGKSSVAAGLAERLHWTCRDSDVEVEKRAGRTIREIFADSGEAEFRRLEREVIGELLTVENLVLAVGGGAILNADTCTDLRAAGPVVWLRATAAVTAARLQADPATTDNRPALTDKSAEDEIAFLMQTREPLYHSTATLTVDTDDASIDDIVVHIGNTLEATLTGGEGTK